MLTRRTNILFEEETWDKLNKIAQKKKLSIGEIVRNAVKKQLSDERKDEQIPEAIASIVRFRQIHGKTLAKGEDSAIIIRRMRDQRYGRNPL